MRRSSRERTATGMSSLQVFAMRQAAAPPQSHPKPDDKRPAEPSSAAIQPKKKQKKKQTTAPSGPTSRAEVEEVPSAPSTVEGMRSSLHEPQPPPSPAQKIIQPVPAKEGREDMEVAEDVPAAAKPHASPSGHAGGEQKLLAYREAQAAKKLLPGVGKGGATRGKSTVPWADIKVGDETLEESKDVPQGAAAEPPARCSTSGAVKSGASTALVAPSSSALAASSSSDVLVRRSKRVPFHEGDRVTFEYGTLGKLTGTIVECLRSEGDYVVLFDLEPTMTVVDESGRPDPEGSRVRIQQHPVCLPRGHEDVFEAAELVLENRGKLQTAGTGFVAREGGGYVLNGKNIYHRCDCKFEASHLTVKLPEGELRPTKEHNRRKWPRQHGNECRVIVTVEGDEMEVHFKVRWSNKEKGETMWDTAHHVGGQELSLNRNMLSTLEHMDFTFRSCPPGARVDFMAMLEMQPARGLIKISKASPGILLETARALFDTSRNGFEPLPLDQLPTRKGGATPSDKEKLEDFKVYLHSLITHHVMIMGDKEGVKGEHDVHALLLKIYGKAIAASKDVDGCVRNEDKSQVDVDAYCKGLKKMADKFTSGVVCSCAHRGPRMAATCPYATRPRRRRAPLPHAPLPSPRTITQVGLRHGGALRASGRQARRLPCLPPRTPAADLADGRQEDGRPGDALQLGHGLPRAHLLPRPQV